MLLAAHVDRGTGLRHVAWRLYDGGCLVSHTERSIPAGQAAGFAAEFRQALLRVVAPPHLLLLWGAASRDVLVEYLPAQIIRELRLADLRACAASLHPTCKASAGLPQLAAAYGLAGTQPDEQLLGDLHDALLWAVLDAASEQGLSWDHFKALPTSKRHHAPFEQYAFDESLLGTLPHAPAVYTMRDQAGTVLYVGKAANLARRMGDYFLPTSELSDKLATLRSQLHSLEFTPVGSELEALLLEQRQIDALSPQVNRQRVVRESPGRYGTPIQPTLIMLPSKMPDRLACFFCGGNRGQALQIEVSLKRLPRQTLNAAVEWALGARATPPRRANVTDWGAEGDRLCCRYFGRHRDQLQWLRLDGGEAAAAIVTGLLPLLQKVADDPPPPGEFFRKG